MVNQIDTQDATPPVGSARDATPLHRFLGFEWSPPQPGSGNAEVRMPVGAQALGLSGNLHGGALATMVDLACALAGTAATRMDLETEALVTADMHVRYLGRPGTDSVVARAHVVRAGSQLIVLECRVTDADDHLVATADFSMMRVPRRRPLEHTRPPGTGPDQKANP